MEQSLKLMISSVESHFREVMDSIKARIYDIEHGDDSAEEKVDICKPYFDELAEYDIQRFHARNKLIISIYSICEASLAGICSHYHVPLKYSPQNKSKQNFYLTDYLFSIGVNYTMKNKVSSPYVVCVAIKPLRNYLAHSQENDKRASEVVNYMKSVGFENIENHNGRIQIESENLINEVLAYCNEMLLISENSAKTFDK